MSIRLFVVALAIGVAYAAPVGALESPAWATALEPSLASLSELDGRSREDYWASRPTVRLVPPPGEGGSEPDITKTLQGALDRMTGGGTIVVPPGTYLQSSCIFFRHARIRLVGDGVRLKAVNNDGMCLLMQADDGEIRGFELTAEPQERGSDQSQTRIVVRGRGNAVRHNIIRGAKAAGIWVEVAQDFVVTDNFVTLTRSDGIHVTGSSTRGVVARNRMDLTGDDGIGIVSYRYQPQPVRNVLVEDNVVSNVSWARGISVVGTSNILIRRNRVVGTGRAAGIIVTREPSYDTYGVENVIIRDNHVEKVAEAFDWPFYKKTGQGSIDINAHGSTTPDLQVRHVLVADNTIVDGYSDGIRMLGGVCDVSLLRNRLTGTGKRSIEIAIPSCEPMLTQCKANVAAKGAVPKSCS